MNSFAYVVAGCHPWNKRVFDDEICKLQGTWKYIGLRDQLTPDILALQKPRYVFFLHWSWKVPSEILMGYECVCFHMTNVPYGRGGSPLQNLILRGHISTMLTALRMTEEFDAGPVYLKAPLMLDGNAEEIYLRTARLSVRMIEQIIREQPEPIPQTGNPVIFKRRRPEESRIPPLESLGEIYDFIRMLDAEGYPRAFIEHNGFRFEFSHASLNEGKVNALIVIRKIEGNDK